MDPCGPCGAVPRPNSDPQPDKSRSLYAGLQLGCLFPLQVAVGLLVRKGPCSASDSVPCSSRRTWLGVRSYLVNGREAASSCGPIMQTCSRDVMLMPCLWSCVFPAAYSPSSTSWDLTYDPVKLHLLAGDPLHWTWETGVL